MKTEQPQRVLIADDHDVVRAGLRIQIEKHLPDCRIVEVADGRGALSAASEGEWRLFLLDIRLPGRSGLDLIPELRTLQTTTPILVISAFAEREYGVRALRQGANGFLHKSSSTRELPTALEKIFSGQSYISADLASALADSLFNGERDQPHDLLSDREMEVLRSIAGGREVQEIAGDMCLSHNTISTYRSRIYRKLSVRNNVEITRYAYKHDLVD